MLILCGMIVLLLFVLVVVAVFNTSIRADAMERDLPPYTVMVAEPTQTPTPKPWVKYPVPLDDNLQKHILGLCKENNVDASIVYAIISAETHGTFDPSVIGDNGNSFGLMQIYRYWHEERIKRLGVTNLLDPYQNVAVGIDILSELLDVYDIDGALNYYNSGSPTGSPNYAYTVLRNAECLMEGALVVG